MVIVKFVVYSVHHWSCRDPSGNSQFIVYSVHHRSHRDLSGNS